MDPFDKELEVEDALAREVQECADGCDGNAPHGSNTDEEMSGC